MITFTTRTGEIKQGQIIHQYPAFEGGMRCIVQSEGREYRCVREGAEYKELVI